MKINDPGCGAMDSRLRGNDEKQRMLFVSHRIPYPPDRGEKIRGWHLIQHLGRKYKLHYGCLIDDPADWQHLPRLRPLCEDFVAFGIDKRRQKLRALLHFRRGRPLMLDYYGHPGLLQWAHETLVRERVDIVYIFSTAMAPYVLHHEGPRRILDMQDVDSEKGSEYATRSRWPMRAVWAREGRTLFAYERAAAMACERTLLVSQPECRRLAELAPELRDRLDWLEQGVDVDFFSPDAAPGNPYPDPAPRVVFSGNMDYWPNADAAIFFANEVMPLLRNRTPAARFIVVGANPTADVRALAALPDIEVTGRVADVRPYVAHAAVSVAPLRIARGIQNKVLEAMALARPVVASPGAFEGVRATAGRDLLVGDGPAELARLVGEVLDGAHPQLGTNARRTIDQGYSWRAVLEKLDRLLEAPQQAGAGQRMEATT
jgi:polysaccharide biosynthesis protein PslH